MVAEVSDAKTYPGWRVMVAPDVNRDWYTPRAWSESKMNVNGKEGKKAKEAKEGKKSEREVVAARHTAEGFVERRLKAGDGDPQRVGTEAATEVELLAGCHAFVGTMKSNLGRVAFELMAARLGYVPPFTCVDRRGWYYGQSAVAGWERKRREY